MNKPNIVLIPALAYIKVKDINKILEFDNVVPGDFVRLNYFDKNNVDPYLEDGIWVNVTDVANDIFTGKVITKSTRLSNSLKIGDEIEFIYEHIYHVRKSGLQPKGYNIIDATNFVTNAEIEKKLDAVKVGNFVKVMFSDSGDINIPPTERMWVEVLELKDKIMIGRLDNDPISICSVIYDDIVCIERKHFIDIWDESNVQRTSIDQPQE